MPNMKVECTICNKKEEISEELLREVGSFIDKHKLKAEHYLYMLNISCGNCMDSSEHSFVFDSEFLTDIQNIINKFDNNNASIQNIIVENDNLVKEHSEHLLKISELAVKIKNNKDRISGFNNKNHELKLFITGITGYDEINIWKE